MIWIAEMVLQRLCSTATYSEVVATDKCTQTKIGSENTGFFLDLKDVHRWDLSKYVMTRKYLASPSGVVKEDNPKREYYFVRTLTSNGARMAKMLH